MDSVKSPVAPQRAPFGSSQPCPGTGGPFPFLLEAPGSTSWRDSRWGYRNLPGGPAGQWSFVLAGLSRQWLLVMVQSGVRIFHMNRGWIRSSSLGLENPRPLGHHLGGGARGSLRPPACAAHPPPRPTMASVVWGTPLPWGQEVTRGLDMSEGAEGHVLQLGVTQPLPAVCPGTSGEHGPWCPEWYGWRGVPGPGAPSGLRAWMRWKLWLPGYHKVR